MVSLMKLRASPTFIELPTPRVTVMSFRPEVSKEHD